MNNQLWKRIKSIPYFGESIVSAYCSSYTNKKNIQGSNNSIQVNFCENLPTIRNVTFDIIGDNNTIVISSGVNIVNTEIKIRGSGSKIVIQENCHITDSFLWSEDSECQTLIGKRTTIVGAYVGVSEPKSSVIIGEDCLLAHSANIRSGDSHSIIDLERKNRLNYAKDIRIENHVWIASRAWILKGVNVGKDSVIATGSIITKDVPQNCIMAGIPAQIKRTNITWSKGKIRKQ